MNNLSRIYRAIIEGIYQYLNGLYVPQLSAWKGYGLVFLLIALFFLLKATITITFEKDMPFLFSSLIVILSSWFGGFGPGLLATFISAFLVYYLSLEPQFALLGTDISNTLYLIFFLFEGILISMLSESRRRSDRQKNEFLGIVSHELKNPLTSIVGYADLISKIAAKRGFEKTGAYARRIVSQVNNLSEMLGDLLDMTKIETGNLSYQDEVFEVLPLVHQIIEDQQVTTKTHEIIFSGKTSKQIKADRYRIGQVITNLISNAIKYSPKARKINVTLRSRGSFVLLSVKDFGMGIAKSNQSRLFNPFYRGDNRLIAKGMGIGLYITHRIVKRYRGRIWVKSKLNSGSTFYLELPVYNESRHV